MKTDTKCVKQVSSHEQHETVKRKTLKVIQHAATDKENLVGRSTDKAIKTSEYERVDTKRKRMLHKSTQAGSSPVVTIDDLTSEEEPGADYWRTLAEKRGAALNDSFKENEKLRDNVDALKEENKICKEMLNESRNLIEVLQEIIGEQEDGAEALDETES